MQENFENTQPERPMTWCERLKQYDRSFLIAYSMQYFNTGLAILLRLAALDLWKNYYDLEPQQTSLIGIFVWLPWDVKILYGVMGDTIAIRGVRKTPWLIIMGLLQFSSLFLAAVFREKLPYQFMAVLLTCANLGSAFCDVIVDALMVVQSKKDPVNGSQDIQSLSWIMQGSASMTGCLLSAFATQFLTPSVCLGFHSVWPLSVAIFAMFMKQPNADQEEVEGDSITFCGEIKRVWGAVKTSWRITTLWKMALFTLLTGVLVPTFNDFDYYFQTNVIGFSQFTFSMLSLIGAVCLLISVFMYKGWLVKFETRSILLTSVIMVAAGTTMTLLFVLRVNEKLGIPDVVFVMFTTTVVDIFVMAFRQLPTYVLYAKLCPAVIEGTVFSVITSISNIVTPISKTFGLVVNSYVGVTKDDMSGYWKLVLVKAIMSLVPLAFVYLIPLHEEVQKTQQKLMDEEKELNKDKTAISNQIQEPLI